MLQTLQSSDGTQFFRDDQERLFLVSDFEQLWKYLQNGGFVISAWQKDASPARNDARHRELVRELIRNRFSLMEWSAEFGSGNAWSNQRMMSVAVMYNPVLNDNFAVFRQKAISLREKFGQSCFFIVENAGANVRFLHGRPRSRFIFRDMQPELMQGFEPETDGAWFFETLHQVEGKMHYKGCARRWYTSGLQSFGRQQFLPAKPA